MENAGIIVGAVLYFLILALILPTALYITRRDKHPVDYDDMQW